MDNKNQDFFQYFPVQSQFRPAVHVHHFQIDNDASELLSYILGRDIRAEGKRSEFYDWSIEIFIEPLSESELVKLYDIIGASEYDREIQSDTNEYHDDIVELCQRISNKLFSKIMPFDVSVSFSDDEGIWFFGDQIESNILKKQ